MPKCIYYLVNICVLEPVELFPHRFEVHRLLDVRQVIRNVVQTNRFGENLVRVDFL
jgi:hypothetical protein